MIYRTPFAITGVANTEVLDSGLTSTEAEEKIVKEIILTLSGHAGNTIKGYLEREQIFGVIDYHIDSTADSGSTDMQLSAVKIARFIMEWPIPVGQTLKFGHACGAGASNLWGVYVYELV